MTEYCAADEIASFFTKTSATRSLCDARARALTGHDATPVAIQGNCSYTVYAGQNSVIQFRLRSLKLHQHTTQLASQVYGDLAPHVTYEGQLGDDRDKDGKEPLLVYHMGRIPGISHLDFILSTENNTAYRATLMADLGGYAPPSLPSPRHSHTAASSPGHGTTRNPSRQTTALYTPRTRATCPSSGPPCPRASTT